MIDSKDILALLSIPCEDVLTSEIIKDTDDIAYVEIELKDNRPNCPFCFSNKVVIKDYYNVKVNNNVIKKNKLFVNIRMRRYKCKSCSKTLSNHLNFIKINLIFLLELKIL